MTTRTWFLALAALMVLAAGLWRTHARAWDLGGRSPVLSFDAAQYAVAARELAETGRLATPFALPVELARHAAPPWPLAVVQPGLVLAEAALLRLTPLPAMRESRERLTLVLPLAAYVAIAALLLFGVRRLLDGRQAGAAVLGAAFVTGTLFLLDPEAQHFATGGFTELPFTLGLVAACLALARGLAPRRPFLFGLLLGVTGAFRGSMLGFAPVFALAAAAIPERLSTRGRIGLAARVLAGFVLPLAPWWIYKWRAFGSPGWDLSALYAPWDGVDGRSWFSLTHRAVEPDLPHGMSALGPLAHKLTIQLPRLGAALLSGPRAVTTIALVVWLARPRGARALRITGIALLAVAAVSLVTAALGAGWIRYLFPVRVPLEAAGLLALWGLVASAPAIPPRARTGLAAGLAVLAIVWGVHLTFEGLAEARATSRERGTPDAATMADLATRVAAAVPPGEAVMSNLGPELAWQAHRPVLHLALDPGAIADCRARVHFRDVLLVFRDPEHAWPGWREVIAHPEAARGSGVNRVLHGVTPDGFQVVWLELAESRP